MVLPLQGRSHRFKSCSAHKSFSEINPTKNTKDPQIIKNLKNTAVKLKKIQTIILLLQEYEIPNIPHRHYKN